MFDVLTRLWPWPRRRRFGGAVPDEYRPGTPLPFVAPEVLLDRCSAEVAELRRSWRLELELFDSHVRPLLSRCAELMQLFPASAADHHAVLGGLLSHSIDTAARCARMAQRPMSPDLVGRAQADAERAWYVIATVAGLLHDIGKPLADFEVYAEVPGAWTARECPHYHGGRTLYRWGQEHAPTGKYVWLWRPGRGAHGHVQERPTASRIVLDPELWRWLAELYPAGVRMLERYLDGDQPSALRRLVTDADHDSVRAYVDRVAGIYGQTTRSEQLLALAIDRMRLWVRTGSWAVNEPGAPVFHTSAGTFIAWPEPATGLVRRLREEGHDDMLDPPALAQALLRRHWLVPGADPTTGMPTDTVRLWLDPVFGTGPLTAVHLRSPTSLFDHGAVPEVVAARLEPPGMGLTSGTYRPSEAVDRSDAVRQPDLFEGPLVAAPAAPPVSEPVWPSPDEALAAKADQAALDRLEARGGAQVARFPSSPSRRGRRSAPVQPQEEVANARKAIAVLGEGGELVLRMIDDVLAGRRNWGEVLFRRGERIAIGYPEPLGLYGPPIELMERLEVDRVIILDQRTMCLAHRDDDGSQWLCLAPRLIEPVLSLVGSVASGPSSHERRELPPTLAPIRPVGPTTDAAPSATAPPPPAPPASAPPASASTAISSARPESRRRRVNGSGQGLAKGKAGSAASPAQSVAAPPAATAELPVSEPASVSTVPADTASCASRAAEVLDDPLPPSVPASVPDAPMDRPLPVDAPTAEDDEVVRFLGWLRDVGPPHSRQPPLPLRGEHWVRITDQACAAFLTDAGQPHGRQAIFALRARLGEAEPRSAGLRRNGRHLEALIR